MSQSKKHSMMESIVNILIGYSVAVISQLLVFPIYDIEVTFSDNLLIGLYFTIISLIRSYLVRRYFNARV